MKYLKSIQKKYKSELKDSLLKHEKDFKEWNNKN